MERAVLEWPTSGDASESALMKFFESLPHFLKKEGRENIDLKNVKGNDNTKIFATR